MPDILTDRKTGKQFILSADVPTGTVTPPTPRYTVTITGGYLDDTPGKTTGSYEEDTVVTITATPPPSGKRFDHFVVEGGNNIDTTPATVTVTRNLSISVAYVDTVTVTLTWTTGIASVTGQGTYDKNTPVTITATLSPDYTFVGWYDTNTLLSTDLQTTITPSTDMTLEARAEAVPQQSWSTPSIEGNFTATEDAPFDIVTGLSCGLTGKYTVTFTEVTSPQANDTYDIYAGLDYATKKGPGSLTTSGTYSAIDISLSVSRAGSWTFKGQITCQGFDTPVPIDITIN